MEKTNLAPNLRNDLVSARENNLNAEQQMDLGMTWFKFISSIVPFFGLKKMLEKEDTWFDSIFSKPPIENSSSFAQGTLFYNAIQLLSKCFNQNAPIKDYKVKSKIHFNKDGVPDDLKSIFTVLVKSFREYLIISYTLKKSPLLKSYYDDFLFCMAGILENNFTKNPAADLDVVMNSEVFIRLVTLFKNHLPLLYFRQMTGSFLYQKISGKILQKLGDIDVDFSKISDSIFKAREIEQLALEIVYDIDAAVRKDTPAYGLKFGMGSGAAIPGRVLLNNSFFAFQNNNSDAIFDSYLSQANGTNFMVHLLKAKNLPNKFGQLAALLKDQTTELANSILKLKTKNEESRKYITYSGLLDVHNVFRKNLEDANFFNINEKIDASGNSFSTFFLIDNSCSIPTKVKTLQQVIVLLISVLSKHIDIFPRLFAYAQKGTNKAVYLTPLVEGATRNIKNWGNLLFFNCNKVNYDPFALHEILRRNERDIMIKNRIPLVFIIGDAWPVSLKKDTKEEGKQIMNAIREKYPNMVLIYIASNPLYQPVDLGYDYYIKLKSEFFSIDAFKNQFQDVILKVIQDNVFS